MSELRNSAKEKYFLRKFRLGDEEALIKHANNWKIAQNLKDVFPFPYTADDADWWVRNVNSLNRNEVFAIEVNNEVVGAIGVIFGTDVYRIGAEIGYWLGEQYWGKGIMRDALEEMTDYVFKNYPSVLRIWAGVFAHNLPSMKVLEKAGYHLECIHQQAVVKNEAVLDEHVWVKLKNNNT